jgi:hypothetical protein
MVLASALPTPEHVVARYVWPLRVAALILLPAGVLKSAGGQPISALSDLCTMAVACWMVASPVTRFSRGAMMLVLVSFLGLLMNLLDLLSAASVLGFGQLFSTDCEVIVREGFPNPVVIHVPAPNATGLVAATLPASMYNTQQNLCSSLTVAQNAGRMAAFVGQLVALLAGCRLMQHLVRDALTDPDADPLTDADPLRGVPDRPARRPFDGYANRIRDSA